VTTKNTAKILDFGLARVGWALGATVTGATLGTPLYMSPEQIQGLTLDWRTDIWSLGAVLYEMLVGRVPFQGDSPEILFRQILGSIPLSLTESRPEVPGELAQIAFRALSKSPDDRYQTAAEMRDALMAFLGDYPIVGISSLPAFRHRHAASTDTIPSIAVLPFANLTSDPDNEYFSDGLTDELITALARLKGIRVVSRTSTFAMKRRSDDVRQIGTLLRVRSVLEGSVRRAGNRLRINVQLIRVDDGFPTWSERYDRELNDIFEVQEELAKHVVEALKVNLLDTQPDLFANRRTANPEVYNQYLRGQYFLNQLNPIRLASALSCFEQALSLDSAYAPAYAGLARYYNRIAFYGLVSPLEVLSKAWDAGSKALELDSRLAEAHATLGEVILPLKWDRTGAEAYYQEAIRLAPGDANLRHPYAMLLMSQGRFDESQVYIREALGLDPLSMPLNNALAFLYLYAREYDRALEVCSKVLEMNPDYFQIYGNKGLALSALGRHEEAVSSASHCRRLSRNNPTTSAFYAYMCATAGRTQEAQDVVDDLVAKSASMYVSPSSLGVAFAGLSKFDTAFEYLLEAWRLHDPPAMFLGVLHPLDVLRSDSRFADLLQKVGLPRTFHPSRTRLMSSTQITST
jgi:eukaryotic-like serine/threonine-protein kinase